MDKETKNRGNDMKLFGTSWAKRQADKIRKVDWIDPALYRKYGVKRGLRNDNGTGVLVGSKFM